MSRTRLEGLAGETGLSPDNTSIQVRYGYPGKVLAAAGSAAALIEPRPSLL